MFGSSNITSAWGQPQQNQQPQQGTSTFGQPAANTGFGAGTFGSGGAFGQQQPQPQANPMFGALGGQPNNSTTTPGSTGFGAFGQTNTASTNTGLFGAPKPTTTGFGAFGGGGTTGTSTFANGGGTFGSGAGASTGTGLFGAQNNTSTGTFGNGGGMFGQAKPATTGFGTTASTTSTAANGSQIDGIAPVATGSSNPPYQAFSEKDPVNSSTMLQYQSISCMPAYRGTSFEELRWQDYQQGRKTAGAFGQTTFGVPATQPATGTGLFGQPAATNPAQPANSVFGGFGATNNTAAPTGTNTAGAFGNFGQPTAGPSNTTAGGGPFGGGAFGQQQQQQQPQQQTTGFGAFGQPQQQQQQQNQPAGGLFGTFGAQANQPKPFGTFGATNTNPTGATGGFGAFGQANQNQPTAAGTGLFGQTQPQQQQQQTTGFSAFGQNNQQKPGLFGQPAQPATNTFGAFSATNQTQPNQTGTQPAGGLFSNTGATGGSLFGITQQNQQPGQQQQPTGGLFGNQTTQPATGGLFGNNNTGNTGGGLFGTNQAQQNTTQPATGGFGLFGQKPVTTTPASGGLFVGGFGQQNTNTAGQNQQQPGGLFGQQQQSTQPAANSFNLFGNKPATLGTQPQQAAGGFGGSLPGGGLGASTAPAGQAAPQQPTLTASIAQPIGANLPIFSMFPPGPRAINLDQPKKKSGLFLDVPTRTPVPRLQLGYTPAASKLRGFTSTSVSPGQPFGGSMSLTNGKPGALSLSKAANQKSLLGPDAILNGSGSTPGLGSGGRQSVKKLILDRKVEPSDLFGKSKATQPRITFNPALSIAARELDAAAAAQRLEPSRSAPKGKFSAQVPNDSAAKEADKAPEPAELKEGDYYVRPSLSDLKKRSFGELASTEGLVVGRVGYGEIQFLEPVDLTGLQRTTELLGEVVRFDDKECSVYPELDDADKPPPGSGLNVAARISLVNCWALDKATREPIKDESHAGAVRHLKRLKNMKDTHFESFDIGEGKWVFTVDHF